MDAIDRDRTLLAAEAGYKAGFTTMDVVSGVTGKHTSEVQSKSENRGAQKDKSQNETAQVLRARPRPTSGRGGGHGGLKNQLLIGWRPPIKRAKKV